MTGADSAPGDIPPGSGHVSDVDLADLAGFPAEVDPRPGGAAGSTAAAVAAEESARAHTTACARCRERLQRVVDLRRQLATLPPVPLPAAVAARLDAALAAARDDRQRAGTRTSGWALAAAAVAVALVAGVGLLRGLNGPSVQRPSNPTAENLAGAGLGSRQQPQRDALLSPTPSRTATATAAALDRDVVATAARALVAVGTDRIAGGSTPSPVAPTADAALARCMAVLRVGAPRVLAAGTSRLDGQTLMIMLLVAGHDPDTADVRVLRPGCAGGLDDVRYALDGVRVR